MGIIEKLLWVILAVLSIHLMATILILNYLYCFWREKRDKAAKEIRQRVVAIHRTQMEPEAVCTIPASQQNETNMPRATFDDVPEGFLS